MNTSSSGNDLQIPYDSKRLRCQVRHRAHSDPLSAASAVAPSNHGLSRWINSVGIRLVMKCHEYDFH